MTEVNQRAPPIRRDRSAQRNFSCTLVAARPRENDVLIDFGDVVFGAGDGELRARLMRRIAMRPLTAKRLCDLLAQLTAEGGVTADAKG
jgi:hypothetical protein